MSSTEKKKTASDDTSSIRGTHTIFDIADDRDEARTTHPHPEERSPERVSKDRAGLRPNNTPSSEKHPDMAAPQDESKAKAPPYWETKTLGEMTDAEWEGLCDGCGKCCLVLIEDEDTGTVWETDVACHLYDPQNRCCTDYENRTARVPDCVRLTPENANALPWMPETCAYRRVARGEPLPDWHPLLTGDPKSTARAGAAATKFLTSEQDIDPDEIFSRTTIERFSA